MSGKDPSVMRIHELKEAIEVLTQLLTYVLTHSLTHSLIHSLTHYVVILTKARGLTSKTLGFVEKHEFVTLLTQEFDQPIINKSTRYTLV